MTRDRIQIERLTDHDTASCDAFIAIYTDSISPREQKDSFAIRRMLSDGRYRVYVARDQEAIVGFAIHFIPDDRRFCLLEYMAVREDRRGLGIGGMLFSEGYRLSAGSIENMPMLIEVDSESGDNDDESRKRQRFYRRMGCKRIEHLRYQLPLSGQGRAPDMDLFLFRPAPVPPLTKDSLAGMLSTIYEDVYHQPASDPRLDRMLKNVSDPAVLG